MTKEPQVFEIPDDLNSSSCKGPTCGAEIFWIPQIKNPDKNFPVNPDGTAHHIDCPDADYFREKARRRRAGA